MGEWDFYPRNVSNLPVVPRPIQAVAAKMRFNILQNYATANKSKNGVSANAWNNRFPKNLPSWWRFSRLASVVDNAFVA